MDTIWPTLFVEFRNSAFSVTKKLIDFLQHIVIIDNQPMLSLTNTDPYQFLEILINNNDKDGCQYRINDNELPLEDVYESIIQKLNVVINSTVYAREYHVKTGLDTMLCEVFPAHVVITCEPRLISDTNFLRELNVILIKLNAYDNAPFISVLIYADNDNINQRIVKELSPLTQRVFLYGSQSNLVLNKTSDADEQVLNLLKVFAQSDANHMGDTIRVSDMSSKIFSFGSSSITYSTINLAHKATVKLMQDEKFIAFYGGTLRDYVADDDLKFVVDIVELDNMKEESGIKAEQFFPVIQQASENLSTTLCDESFAELIKQELFLKKSLNRDIFEERTKELLRFGNIIKQPVNKWNDYLDFLDFLFRYEIINSAKDRVEKLKEGFYDIWITIITDKIIRIKQSNDSTIASPVKHNGETLIAFCYKIIHMIKPKILEQSKAKEVQPPDRDKVMGAVAKIPYLSGVILRILLLILIVLIPGTILLNKIGMSKIWSFFASLTLSLMVSFIYLWFSYLCKLLDLWDLTKSYLRDKEISIKAVIANFEQDLISSYFRLIVRDIQHILIPHYGYFKEYSEDNLEKDRILKFDKFRLVENYFYNRKLLTKVMTKKVKYILSESEVCPLIRKEPILSSEEENSIATWISNNINWDSIFKNKPFSQANASDEMWNSILSNDEVIKTIINLLISGIEEEVNRLIVFHGEFDNLMDYLHSKKKKITSEEIFKIYSQSKPTFKIKEVENNSKLNAYLWNGEEELIEDKGISINSTFDKNSIIFLQLDGPYEFNEIEWRV
jgi:hypothetical protein